VQGADCLEKYSIIARFRFADRYACGVSYFDVLTKLALLSLLIDDDRCGSFSGSIRCF
jgi:hypothetical protein